MNVNEQLQQIANIKSSVSKDSAKSSSWSPALGIFWNYHIRDLLNRWGKENVSSGQSLQDWWKRHLGETCIPPAREFSCALPVDNTQFLERILLDWGGRSLLWSITTCSWHRQDQTMACNCKMQYVVVLKLLVHKNNKQNELF